ncbi:DHH family phosphoesterase [Candidatus Woesearchaeota archaeon]|nr:DHH family phosphoesterase [Candidatus Woesearchaeota archaeon]
MLKKSDYSAIKEHLNCENPLFFMHDDPDGLASFLLLYKYVGRGHGVLVKTNPVVDSKYLRKVDEYHPDKVFVLDIAVLKEDFTDSVKVPVVWIDHHEPVRINGVFSYNPRFYNPETYVPATYLCYRSVMQKENLWIAMVGCIGDWYFADFAAEFSSQYPDLMGSGISNADDAMFGSRLGTLVRLFSFVIKGRHSDAMKCVKILTRIRSPYDILDQRNPDGKYLFRRYEKFNTLYQRLLSKAVSGMENSHFCVFTYTGDTSFSSDLANELLYLNPDSFVIVGREKDDEVRMSIRSKKTTVLPKLRIALHGVNGYGGGHEYACGACVKKKDFDKFVDAIRMLL